MTFLAGAAVAAGLGFAAALGLGAVEKDKAPVAASAPPPAVFTQDLPGSAKSVPATRVQVQQSFAPVAKSASPAVVNVYATRTARRSPMADDPFFRRFFGVPDQPRVQSALGSGVLVRENGIVVTNNHVVEGADALRVVLADRREFDAKVVATDPKVDLAVLKIETGGERLPALQFADTRALEVGDLVLAIGNPFGVGQTVTSGIVSALARTDVGITDYSFFIQTDASINPGNSGGALVDLSGRLVGVNTAIYSRDGGSNGIGFAIPSEMVRRAVESAIGDGKIVKPWLGVRGQPVDQDLAKALGLSRPTGVLVTDLYAGGPGARAGLKPQDVVLSIDGQEVSDDAALRFLAATRRPGEAVRLEVNRNGKKLSMDVKVEALPDSKASPKVIAGDNPFGGAEVIELSPAAAEEAAIDPFMSGVLVRRVDPRGEAAYLGVRPGDLVREVNGRAVTSIADLEAALKAKSGTNWDVTLERDGRRLQARFRM